MTARSVPTTPKAPSSPKGAIPHNGAFGPLGGAGLIGGSLVIQSGRRALAILDGDPGLGKTELGLLCGVCDSTGRALPDGSPALWEPSAVLYFTAEDDVARTLKPRVEALGGDQHRIFVYTTLSEVDPATGAEVERLPTLRDLDWLEREITETGARLVVFDPLVAYLPAEVNANSDRQMRTVLTPLAHLAERTGAVILFIRAKAGLGITTFRREYGPLGQWFCRLPAGPATELPA